MQNESRIMINVLWKYSILLKDKDHIITETQDLSCEQNSFQNHGCRKVVSVQTNPSPDSKVLWVK